MWRAVPTDGATASKALRKEAAALADATGVDGDGVPRDVALNGALMAQARDLIEVEQGIVRGERGAARGDRGRPLASLAAFRAHLAGAHSSLWEPRSKRVVASDGGSASDLAAARRAAAERAQAHAQRLRAAATQLAGDVAREQAAWQTRCATLATQARQVRGESEEAWCKLEAFRAQAAQEARAIERRVARSKADVDEVARRELSQQAAFQVLSDRRRRVVACWRMK
jgi:hypothetical protein